MAYLQCLEPQPTSLCSCSPTYLQSRRKSISCGQQVPTECSLGDCACEGGKQQVMEEVARQSGGSSQVIKAPPAAPAKVQCILLIPPEPLLDGISSIRTGGELQWPYFA